MESKETRKARIMKAINMINNAKSKTIKLTQKYPAFLTRTIERNSKTIKDSDPLSSTMSIVRQKFPITMKANHEFASIVRKDLVMGSKDMRNYGRIPVKKDAVTEYQNLKIQPKESEVQVIDSIFEYTLRFWNKMKDVEWEKVSFIHGRPNLERRLAVTNPVERPIEKGLRVDAIAQVLGVSSWLEYNNVTDYAVDIIKDMLKADRIGTSSLARVVHMILGMVDEQLRFLPVIPGVSSHFSRIYHILFQPTYRVLSLPNLNESSRGRNIALDEASQMLIHVLHTTKDQSYSKDIGTLKESIENSFETANIKLAVNFWKMLL